MQSKNYEAARYETMYSLLLLLLRFAMFLGILPISFH